MRCVTRTVRARVAGQKPPQAPALAVGCCQQSYRGERAPFPVHSGAVVAAGVPPLGVVEHSRGNGAARMSDRVPTVHSFLNPTRESAEGGRPETESAFRF